MWDGPGTTRIVIDPPLDIVMIAVESSIDKVKAVDEDITIVPVETVPIDISTVVNVSLNSAVPLSDSEKEAIQFQVLSVIETYINGGYNSDGTPKSDLGIDNDFIPFQMERYIAEQISSVLDISTPYPAAPIPIDGHQKAVMGTADVKVI